MTPKSLNVKSNGKWAQAQISIPNGSAVEKVVLTYNGKTLVADEFKQLNGKVNAKFNRAELIEILSEAKGTVEVRVGVKAGDEWFTATDQITLKRK